MLRKVIKYTDYDDNEREEVFYFNLSRAELIELQHSELGGLTTIMEKIIASQDNVKTMNLFKEIILKAYGEKSPDGKHIFKSEKLSTEFTQTEAYSELIMELLGDAEGAARFIEAIIPKEASISAAKNGLQALAPPATQ